MKRRSVSALTAREERVLRMRFGLAADEPLETILLPKWHPPLVEQASTETRDPSDE